jgi:hypothetical protein
VERRGKKRKKRGKKEERKGEVGARTGGKRFAFGFIATPGYKGLSYRLGAAPEKRRLKGTALHSRISA